MKDFLSHYESFIIIYCMAFCCGLKKMNEKIKYKSFSINYLLLSMGIKVFFIIFSHVCSKSEFLIMSEL